MKMVIRLFTKIEKLLLYIKILGYLMDENGNYIVDENG
jgi:hypothetical protein